MGGGAKSQLSRVQSTQLFFQNFLTWSDVNIKKRGAGLSEDCQVAIKYIVLLAPVLQEESVAHVVESYVVFHKEVVNSVHRHSSVKGMMNCTLSAKKVSV